jgi:hypothetical protein
VFSPQKIGIIILMSIKTNIEKDIIDAMRSGDVLRKNTLRMALSAIKLAEIEKGGSLDDAVVMTVLQKEIKSRRETILDAERAKRPDLVADAEAEIALLETYLPTQLSQQELDSMAQEAIDEVGATSTREIGLVMKVLLPRVQGRAEGSMVSQVVRQLLA